MGIYESTIGRLTKDRELHIPGYQFCGPGTRVQERIGMGQRGINELDNACMHHDIAYGSKEESVRRAADIDLRNHAYRIAFDPVHTHGLQERAFSFLTGSVIQIKNRVGFY